jgi:hypothetical protein
VTEKDVRGGHFREVEGAKMTEQSDLELRYSRRLALWYAIWPVLCLCVVVSGGFTIARPVESGALGWLLWLCPPLLLIGSGGFFLLRALLRLLDRSVKLSLTTEGLRDHRKGTLIRWEEIRGLRHEVRVSRGPIFEGAMLYVRVSEDGEAREVGIDVLDLDLPPWRIEELVEQRRKDRLAARWKVLPAQAEAPAVREGD